MSFTFELFAFTVRGASSFPPLELNLAGVALKAELKEHKAFIQAVNDKVELNKSAPQTVLNDQ